MLFYLPVHSYSDLYYTSYARLLSSLPPDPPPDCAPIETRGGNCFSSPTARRSQPKHQTAAASSARSILLGDVIEALERLAGGVGHCRNPSGFRVGLEEFPTLLGEAVAALMWRSPGGRFE